VTFVTVTKCHNFEFVTSVTRSGFFWVFLTKQIWSQMVKMVTNGHKFKYDWYKPVSVSVSIEMVWNEQNTAKHTRK